jgi:hypothetical protein
LRGFGNQPTPGSRNRDGHTAQLEGETPDMGWLVAIFVLPLLFVVGMTIAVKLTFLLLRLLFAPARVLSWW